MSLCIVFIRKPLEYYWQSFSLRRPKPGVTSCAKGWGGPLGFKNAYNFQVTSLTPTICILCFSRDAWICRCMYFRNKTGAHPPGRSRVVGQKLPVGAHSVSHELPHESDVLKGISTSTAFTLRSTLGLPTTAEVARHAGKLGRFAFSAHLKGFGERVSSLRVYGKEFRVCLFVLCEAAKREYKSLPVESLQTRKV